MTDVTITDAPTTEAPRTGARAFYGLARLIDRETTKLIVERW